MIEKRAQMYAEMVADTEHLQSIIKAAYIAGGESVIDILGEIIQETDNGYDTTA